ncbi:biotin/lipoyl-binding protein [Nocardioides sp. YIM 152588]|uniref:HlyD family efflux transporter periplasmic adaptor subunit n=1 Tax=Nocardioides sp. YIM 152588 TaxID=3158259 RepID=UPI0032E3DA06
MSRLRIPLRLPARRRLVAPLAVLAVGATAWAGYGAVATDAPSYRLASTTLGDIEQRLALTGTVASTGRVDLTASTSGTVADVAVEEGDRVRKGEVLIRLDRTALEAAVTSARADLAAARAQLESDEEAQVEAVTEAVSTATGAGAGATGDTGGTGSSAGPTGQSGDTAPTGSDDAEDPGASGGSGQPGQGGQADQSGQLAEVLATLRAQQEAVIAASSAAGAAIATADEALATEQAVCPVAGDDTDAGDVADGSEEDADGAGDTDADDAEGDAEDDADADDTDADDTDTDDTDADDTDADGISTECSQALQAVRSAQADVASAQDELQTALTELGGTLTMGAGILGGTGGDSGQPSGDPTSEPTDAGSGSGSDSGSAGSGSATDTSGASGASGTSGATTQGGAVGTVAVTAATLARDQARIDAARATLVEARQALERAEITAPAAGRIVSLDVAEGDEVSSGQQVAVLVGRGLTTVEIAATEAQARQLEPGQAVEVTPAGSPEPITATVSRIDHVPSGSGSTSGSTTGSTTYPVVLTLDAADRTPALGMPVSASVLIGTAEDAVTVPVSAVSDGTVTVLDAGTTTRVRVTTGIVGASTVEILDGLEPGQDVVLADLDADLPSGDDSSGQGAGPGGRNGGFGGPPSGGVGGMPGGGRG